MHYGRGAFIRSGQSEMQMAEVACAPLPGPRTTHACRFSLSLSQASLPNVVAQGAKKCQCYKQRIRGWHRNPNPGRGAVCVAGNVVVILTATALTRSGRSKVGMFASGFWLPFPKCM